MEGNVENLREKLEKANAEVARLTKYVDDVINEKDILLKISTDKIERLQSNLKLLEGQHETIVSEKFNLTKKLKEVGSQFEVSQRELEQVKEVNEKQKREIIDFKSEIDEFNEEKKSLKEKFKSLKKDFDELDEQFTDVNAREVTAACAETVKSRTSRARTTPLGVEPQDRNQVLSRNVVCADTVKSKLVRARTTPLGVEPQNGNQILSCNMVQMARISGTVIKRSSVEMMKTPWSKSKKTKTEKCSITTSTKAELNREDTNNGSKRGLTCRFCSKRYKSTPASAFCICQNDNLYDDDDD